ncbi:MAG TPA: hypothetical protein VFG73_02300 [Rhodanobacteraceae bacterium]|nr:hypothetical protein [Rhodanobacteraceae bacterium]
MSAKFSIALQNYVNVTGSLKAALESSAAKIYLYSGPVPASADEAIDAGSTLLATIGAGAAHTDALTFEAASSNGVLTKTAAETWAGVVAASGTATFLRLCVGADTGSAAAGAADYRVQDTVGEDASYGLQLTSAALVAGNTQAIDVFQILN